MNGKRSIAYFSMEIAADAGLPTYAGGLGILAGDTLRSCADLGVPIVGVTLIHRKGYLTQSFDASGWQREAEVKWDVGGRLTELPERAAVRIDGRAVAIRAWRHEITGISGEKVPVLFLDTDLPENAEWDRTLTHFLYGGDDYYRLCQEVVLGIGGVRMLEAVGLTQIARFHMNEEHSSLLTLELLRRATVSAGRRAITGADIETVRRQCIFTTHTPVEAAHDRFPMSLVAQVFGRRGDFFDVCDVFCGELVRKVVQRANWPGEVSLEDIFSEHNVLNLTFLALNLSHYVNGVAKRHAEVSRGLYGKPQIDAITNGVHATTWTAPAFQELFDRRIPGWRADNFSLRYAHGLPSSEIWSAHQAAKEDLLALVQARGGRRLDPGILTLGFARRATPYKRASLLLADEPRLKAIAAAIGGLQLVFAGKAHPNDHAGKAIIQGILRRRDALLPSVDLVYLEDYDLEMARTVVAGVDVWINTPLPPLEASGTSGMKAALNGVPSLSVLDGWWIEGCIEGATGWAIDGGPSAPPENGDRNARDAALLYDKLERIVAPLYCRERDRFINVMRHTIALNASFFNTQRMVQQYVLKAYFE